MEFNIEAIVLILVELHCETENFHQGKYRISLRCHACPAQANLSLVLLFPSMISPSHAGLKWFPWVPRSQRRERSQGKKKTVLAGCVCGACLCMKLTTPSYRKAQRKIDSY